MHHLNLSVYYFEQVGFLGPFGTGIRTATRFKLAGIYCCKNIVKNMVVNVTGMNCSRLCMRLKGGFKRPVTSLTKRVRITLKYNALLYRSGHEGFCGDGGNRHSIWR